MLRQDAERHLIHGGRPCYPVVNNSYLQQLTIQTGMVDVEIKVPKVRIAAATEYGSTASYYSLILSVKNLEELLTMAASLRGIFSGDFTKFFGPFLVKYIVSLPSSSISRLK
ncbi:MAG: hypothetical protein ACTS73_02685 [Arsenophonus sp. NEOnobi-MAG3]